MSEEALSLPKDDQEWFQVDMVVRGYEFSLDDIRHSYREFQKITTNEGKRVILGLVKPDAKTDGEWNAELEHYRKRAFLVTVSIIGKNGVNKYGESEDIFASKDLPLPVETVYFTNQNSFAAQANGKMPQNKFEVWLEFGKPPILDTNPLLSEPTPNLSRAAIRAEDIGYFGACQNTVETRIKKSANWYRSIHGRFAYDLGFWLIALPYSLYAVTSTLDHWLPENSKYSSYRVAGYIYGFGISVIIYRTLFTYLKWAFPVNVLVDNKDYALKHRIIFGGLVATAFSKGIFALVGQLFPQIFG